MSQRPQTVGELCSRIDALIPWLRSSPNRRVAVVLSDGGSAEAIFRDVLMSDEVRAITEAGGCQDDATPINDPSLPQPDTAYVVDVLMALEEAKAKDDQRKYLMIGGAVLVGGAVLYFATRRSEPKLPPMPMSGLAGSVKARASLSGGPVVMSTPSGPRCHDGRKFVKNRRCGL